MDNDIKTWKQGYFVDHPRYKNWSQEGKNTANADESLLVRPYPTGNHICRCPHPDNARWIASRLNLASTLEQMTYDFATGKTDGSELKKFVETSING